jgi:hypothetical protein
MTFYVQFGRKLDLPAAKTLGLTLTVSHILATYVGFKIDVIPYYLSGWF